MPEPRWLYVDGCGVIEIKEGRNDVGLPVSTCVLSVYRKFGIQNAPCPTCTNRTTNVKCYGIEFVPSTPLHDEDRIRYQEDEDKGSTQWRNMSSSVADLPIRS